MSLPQVVVDTNVVVASLLSQRGAAYLFITLADSGLFEINISVPLVLEYEDAAKRILSQTALTENDLNNVLDYLCYAGNQRQIYYLWRPVLRDAKDDMVLELAVASGSQFIITFNRKDFAGAEQFGIEILTPKEFLQRIGRIP